MRRGPSRCATGWSSGDAAALARALASRGAARGRPAAAAGVFLAGVLAGTAVTAGYALGTGFDRAQRAAGTADVIARFDPLERSDVDARLGALANVRERSYRLVVRPVDLRARRERRAPEGHCRGQRRRARPRVGRPRLVEGRGLSGAPGEAVIERGLADAWGLAPRRGLRVAGLRRTVVGVAVEPDNVAFPLAARPRVYLRVADVRRRPTRRASESMPPTTVAIAIGCRRRSCRRGARATGTRG